MRSLRPQQFRERSEQCLPVFRDRVTGARSSISVRGKGPPMEWRKGMNQPVRQAGAEQHGQRRSIGVHPCTSAVQNSACSTRLGHSHENPLCYSIKDYRAPTATKLAEPRKTGGARGGYQWLSPYRRVLTSAQAGRRQQGSAMFFIGIATRKRYVRASDSCDERLGILASAPPEVAEHVLVRHMLKTGIRVNTKKVRSLRPLTRSSQVLRPE